MADIAKELRARAIWWRNEGEIGLADEVEADLLDRAADALDAAHKRIAELEDRQVAAREFVVRHPSLTLIDLAEFDAYLRVTDALSSRIDKEDRNG